MNVLMSFEGHNPKNKITLVETEKAYEVRIDYASGHQLIDPCANFYQATVAMNTFITGELEEQYSTYDRGTYA